MKLLNHSFKNKELEKKFQLQILKQQQKSFVLYHFIPIICNLVLIVDQSIKQNTIMIFWFIGQETILVSYLIFSFIYPKLFNYLSYYYYLVDIIVGTLQLCFFEFKFLSLEVNDVKIYQDILLQFFLIYHTRHNYIGGSLTFIYFISIRVYIQIGYGFSLSSIAYLVTGPLFIIDQYKQEKFRRKLFLKSQRNKQLELLIEEFIDDQISIIEKDSENVRFKTMIFNKKYFDMANQFVQFLKDIQLPLYKEQLLNYLYKTIKQKEILLGRHENNNYEITYQSFTLKKQQMFLKIKLLDQKLDSLVNYKKLYTHLIQGIQLRPQQLYKGKQIMKSLYMKSFYYQFTSYFQYYRPNLEAISYQYFKYIFTHNQIQWISNTYIKPFYSDKKLVFLLVYLIKQINSNEILILNMEDSIIKIEFNVRTSISQYYITQINKILYHIGYHQLYQSIQSSKNVCITLLDMQGLEKYY